MFASLLLLLASTSITSAEPPRLPHAWMNLGDSQKTIGGSPVTIHHYADMSSASISPENGYRRIWLKDEWHPPLWKQKGNMFLAELVEMDCAGHRSRYLAFETTDMGFVDSEKDAEWQAITAGSAPDAFCQVPKATFLP